MLWSIAPFRLVSNCFTYTLVLSMLGMCVCVEIYICYIFLMNGPLYHYILFNFVSLLFWLQVYFVWYEYVYIDFLWISFSWSITFNPFTLTLHLSLELRWVFWRQHIVLLFFNAAGYSVSFDWWIQSITWIIIDRWN